MRSKSAKTKCSYVVMGLGQFLYGQWAKGLLYMGILGLYLWYLFTAGITDMVGFFTLGTVEGDPWLGVAGDDSIIMMLRGILSFLILIAVVVFYFSNIKDVKNNTDPQLQAAKTALSKDIISGNVNAKQ